MKLGVTKEEKVQVILNEMQQLKQNISNLEKNFLSLCYDDEDENDFLVKLTDNEQKVFAIIQSEVKRNDGMVSISKLVESNEYSRSVFMSVIQKMKQYNIAIITNKGVKGTHIQFFN
jgi:GTP-sensing pleiotropic transcriptional regulator CodY